MDFLGLDYTQVIYDNDLFDREYKELLNRLLFSEPRASMSLYPSVFDLSTSTLNKTNKDAEKKANTTESSLTKSKDKDVEGKEQKVDIKGKSKRQTGDDDADISITTPEKKKATEKAKSKPELCNLDEPRVSPPYTEFRRNPQLELYFSLYIWTLIAVGKYLDATGLVKRYHKTELFRKSPIIIQSAKAAFRFNQTYVPSLINYLREIDPSLVEKEEDSDDAESKSIHQWVDRLSVPPSSQGLSISSYNLVYELNAAYPWSDEKQGGSSNLDQVVAVALDNFQKLTYERIKNTFTAIRIDTLKYFLGLPKEWNLNRTLQFFKDSGIKETGEWKVQKLEDFDDEVMKDDDDEVSSVVLIPPQSPERKPESVTKKSSFQELVNAAIHLEKKVAI